MSFSIDRLISTGRILPALRRFARRLHLWVGLPAGALLTLLGATGSVLVYGDAIRERLHPELHAVRPAGTYAELERVRDSLESRLGSRSEAVRRIELPAASEDPILAWTTEGRVLFVDPYSARVRGVLEPAGTIVGRLEALHVRLLAGAAGSRAVGILGLALVLLAVTGLALPGRGDRAHARIGCWTLPILLIAGGTGAALGWGVGASEGTLGADARAAAEVPPITPPEHGERIIPLDAAVEVARSLWPEGRVSAVEVPRTESDPIAVRVRPGGAFSGAAYLAVDPYRGNVVRIVDGRAAGWGERIARAIRPVHVGTLGTGTYGSEAVRLLYALFGLIPGALTVTGTRAWLRRRRRAVI